MPPSSSAKKVARVAARSGSTGRPSAATTGPKRNWLFPLAIVALVAIGVGLIVFAKSRNSGATANTAAPRANLNNGKPADHWHAAFAVNVCGKELASIPEFESAEGVHTHGDGLIHIHPFELRAAGKGATMGRFWKGAELKVTDTSFKVGGTNKVYEAGKTTCGSKPTELVLAYWKRGITAEAKPPDQIIRKDLAKTRFTGDLAAYTLALVPKGSTKIPAPSSAAKVAALGGCDGAKPDPTVCGSPSGQPAVPGGGGAVPGSDGSSPVPTSGSGG